MDLACVARIATISNHKVSDRKHIKMLTAKQMLQRLPIGLAQVKAGNTSESVLSKIRQRQTMQFLYRAKESTKKVYNNLMNSIKL